MVNQDSARNAAAAFVELPLTTGQVTKVDADDAEWIRSLQVNLTILRQKSATPYARFCTAGKAWGRYPKLLHRAIMHEAGYDTIGLVVDHINGDTLDNRKQNLRVASKSQNAANMRKHRGSSKFKGVCWNRKSGKWAVEIKVNGKTQYLGMYADEILAAKVYDTAAKHLFGEFAQLNFPKLPGEITLTREEFDAACVNALREYFNESTINSHTLFDYLSKELFGALPEGTQCIVAPKSEEK